MSGNQKQAPPGGPSQQAPPQMAQSRYVQGSYMQQRSTPPQRTDGFHVPGQQAAYVQPPQQQPNQGNNQVPSMRGLQSAGPAQASTPPNADIKVQQISQQPSMNIAYVPQSQVRGTQNFYARPPSQSNQTPRMANRQGQQPPMYPYGMHAVASVPPTVYMNAAAVPYFNGGARPPAATYMPQYPMIPGQHITYQYSQPQSQVATFFYNTPQQIPRTQAPVQTTPQNPAQPPTPTILPQIPQASSVPKQKRRSNAIAIINPDTGVNLLDEIYEQEQNESRPPSEDSSAPQTPHPPPNNNKEVQAAFAKQVYQAISKDEEIVQEEPQLDHHPSHHPHHHHHPAAPPVMDHMGGGGPGFYHQPPPIHTQVLPPRMDTIIHSKLHAATKEFVPLVQQIVTPKEITPVVSAITDAEEVTISKPKDRESPTKGRKREQHREPQLPKENAQMQPHVHHHTPPPSAPVKETVEKQTPVREEKPQPPALATKEVLPPFGPPSGQQQQQQQQQPPREEKKGQKKERIEVKTVVNEESSPEVPPASVAPPPVVQEVVNTAKSNRNSSQKAKDVAKQQQQQSQAPAGSVPPPTKGQTAPASVHVPPSQPAKPNNKTSKLREINQKGASKEGTDMDAFNDNLIQAAVIPTPEPEPEPVPPSDTNANLATTTPAPVPPVKNDNVNSATLNNNDADQKLPEEAPPPPPPPAVKTNEIKTLPKAKVDITDIVKDVPRPYTRPAAPPPPRNQDETDFVNEQLVQAKNEANAKASAELNDVAPEIKPKMPYRDGHWSPSNPTGKKVYERDLLLALRMLPNSSRKPEHALPAALLRGGGDIGRFSVGSGRTDFAPAFSNSGYMNKSYSQQRAGIPKQRGSLQGNKGSSSGGGGGGGGGGKSSKQGMIRVSISVKEDVKLHETENAWKPTNRLSSEDALTEEEIRTQDLFKRFRGILNKLTPQKFDTLLQQVNQLKIDTGPRLEGVINLVFEKAVDEPNFSVMYANLCKALNALQVPKETGKDKKDESKKEEFANFRSVLVTRCQSEFETNSTDESVRVAKAKEIAECTDAAKKKDLLLDLEEYDRRLRMKSVGNIRFIGELYKKAMLTASIMMRCLNDLLKSNDEESLECLCKLLTTIGQDLESKNVDLSPIFTNMKAIADKKDGSISSRVRFMLQDVIDLRNAKWVPRRQDLNPKTMDQIQKEADHEHLTIQALNSAPLPARRDDRGSIGPSSEKKRRNVTDDGGWSTAVSSRSRGGSTTFNVRSEILRNTLPQADEPLGSSAMFGTWGRGSKAPTQPSTNTGNMYAPLENIGTDNDRRSMGVRGNSKDSYSSKGPSLERNSYRQSYDGRGSRSGSQHRSRDNSAASKRSTTLQGPPSMPPMSGTPKMTPPASVPVPAPVPVEPQISEEALKGLISSILDEFIDDCCTVVESNDDIKRSKSLTSMSDLVSIGYSIVLERSSTARLKTGLLFAKLIHFGTLSIKDYFQGLSTSLECLDDLIIDIPQLWTYLGEIIAPLISQNAIPLKDIYNELEPRVSQNYMPKLLACIFQCVIKDKGPNYLQASLVASGLTLSDLLPQSQVNSFVVDNKFEFLLETNTDASAGGNLSTLSNEEMLDKLLGFLQVGTSFDIIVNWILANVGDRVASKEFIRVLATAIFEHSIYHCKLNKDILSEHNRLLTRFVDHNPNSELQCLYALQALIHKLEHPQGLLLSICDTLYEMSFFSGSSFIAWADDNDPAEQEGKGVALKQLTSFFTHLKENDDDTSDGEDA